jgi:hypothetical protein
MKALRRVLASLLAVSLAAGPVFSAEIAAGPQWMQAFSHAAIPGTSVDCGPLAAALIAQGVTPERFALAGTNAQALIDDASLSYVKALMPKPVRGLDNGALAAQHLRVAAAKAALGPYLSVPAAVAVENAALPLFQEARRRELADNQNRLTAVAAALGESTAELEEAGVVTGATTIPPLRLAPPQPRPQTPRRPTPRAPVAVVHEAPNPVGRIVRLAAFGGALIGLFGGRAPVVFADMDETVAPSQQPAAPEMIRAIAGILKAGGSYGIITGSSVEMARKNVVEPLRRELGDEPALLERLAIAARSGSQIYRYDVKKKDFTLKRVGALDGYLISRGVHDGLDAIRGVLRETIDKFGLRAQKGVLLVEDRVDGTDVLTQFVLVPTGNEVTKADKKKYDEAGGRAARERYAAYINHRLRGLGIPVEARVAGKTSIDVGVDKSLGFQALSEEFKVPADKVLWAGDSHGPFGNDAPAAKMAGLVLNVGPRAGIVRPSFQEHDGGPAATLAYFKVVGTYARASAWWRLRLRWARRRIRNLVQSFQLGS